METTLHAPRLPVAACGRLTQRLWCRPALMSVEEHTPLQRILSVYDECLRRHLRLHRNWVAWKMYLDGQVEDMSRVGRFEDGDQYTATVWLDIHMDRIPAPFREEFERAEAAYDDQSQSVYRQFRFDFVFQPPGHFDGISLADGTQVRDPPWFEWLLPRFEKVCEHLGSFAYEIKTTSSGEMDATDFFKALDKAQCQIRTLFSGFITDATEDDLTDDITWHVRDE